MASSCILSIRSGVDGVGEDARRRNSGRRDSGALHGDSRWGLKWCGGVGTMDKRVSLVLGIGLESAGVTIGVECDAVTSKHE